MFLIQNQTQNYLIIPNMPPIFNDIWIVNNIDLNYYGQQQHTINTSLNEPFGNITNSKIIWSDSIIAILYYYINYQLKKYNIPSYIFLKQMLEGGYLYGQYSALLDAWDVLLNLKNNYYDISVGEDDAGYTYKEMQNKIIFENQPLIFSKTIRKQLYNKNLYKIYTNIYPNDLTSPQLKNNNYINVRMETKIMGEYKYYVDDILIRENIIINVVNNYQASYFRS